jgi:hypothetical protein
VVDGGAPPTIDAGAPPPIPIVDAASTLEDASVATAPRAASGCAITTQRMTQRVPLAILVLAILGLRRRR